MKFLIKLIVTIAICLTGIIYICNLLDVDFNVVKETFIDIFSHFGKFIN